MKDYLKYASLGFEILATMVVCGLIGYFLDKWLGTHPWILMVMCILACVLVLLRIMKIK